MAGSRTDTGVVERLAALALFADASAAELEAIAHLVEERQFADGERILRQGLTGSGFYLILDGEAAIRLDGKDYGSLGRGDFFGEISALLGEPPVADVVASHGLRCAVISGPDLEGFLTSHPRVLYRMLQAEARKLRAATRWRG